MGLHSCMIEAVLDGYLKLTLLFSKVQLLLSSLF